MNYLEAEDDGHGPVPMEVGAMKGKKGDRGKKGYGKGKFGKNLGKYDKSNEHSKRNDYSKGSEKGRERGKKGKGKGQGKTRNQLQIPVSKATAEHVENVGHKASECWQGYVQAVEEVPSSSRVQCTKCSNHTGGCEDSSIDSRIQMLSRDQDGSSA